MTDVEAMVRNFHWKFDCGAPEKPELLNNRERALRQRLINEEKKEVFRALEAQNLQQLAKELADLVYVAVGTAIAYGIPFNEVFRLVHAANMTKTGEKDRGGKIMKGPNYVPPDLSFIDEG